MENTEGNCCYVNLNVCMCSTSRTWVGLVSKIRNLFFNTQRTNHTRNLKDFRNSTEFGDVHGK